MELSIGMFIRTKTGKIAKIINKYDNSGSLHRQHYVWVLDDCSVLALNSQKVVKISNEITDLIEPQDLMYIDIDSKDGCGGIVVPRIAETLNELEKWKDRIKSGECKLVSVTTHEAIESISYKVGE